MGFCGGHGDRLNGLLSVFLMAAAQRSFVGNVLGSVVAEMMGNDGK